MIRFLNNYDLLSGLKDTERDLQRLVANCHYFVNFQYLDMLESIVQKHVPRRYFREIS